MADDLDEIDAADPIEEFDDVLADLDDTTPTPEQQMLVDRGGFLTGESDRSDSGGVPLGESPDKFDGVVVSIPSFTENAYEPGPSFRLDGKGDKVLKEVMARYASQMNGDNSPKDRMTATVAAYTEVAAIKAAAGNPVPKVSPRTVRPAKHQPARPVQKAQAPAAPPDRPPVKVVISMGALYGDQEYWYADAIINGSTLVLVADPEAAAKRGGWRPPKPQQHGQPQAFELQIAGLDAPVRAYPMGLDYEFEGRIHYVLVIDRAE